MIMLDGSVYKAKGGHVLGLHIEKADIALECPDISISMIEQTLKKLLTEGVIEKVGRGKQTAYVKR